MSDLRIGVVGYGVQGREHAGLLRSGSIPGAQLTAVVDRHACPGDQREGVAAFASLEACLAAHAVDAVVIATPHASHVTLTSLALRAGCHVLVEKPVAISSDEVDALLAVHAACGPSLVLAAVQNQRTDPRYQQIRCMLASGVLGAVQRVVWTVTDWYRTQAYYDSAPWRGTWCGEGGGVLVNQAVHQLDLWCWLFGLPTRLQARCSFGAWHDIGVEDEVSMLCDLPGGGSGVFIASTGSSPGVNRLEVDCDQGRMVVDAEGLTWQRTSMAVGAHRRHSPNRAEHLPITREHVAHPNHGPQLAGILADFAIACRTGCSPLAPVAVVRAQIALANAILVAACQGTAVELPLTAGRFAALHGELMQREKARNQPRMARAVG